MRPWSDIAKIVESMPEQCMNPERALAVKAAFHDGPGLIAQVVVVTPQIHLERGGQELHAAVVPLQFMLVMN